MRKVWYKSLARTIALSVTVLMVLPLLFAGCSSDTSKRDQGQILYSETPEENIVLDEKGISYYANNEILIVVKENTKKKEIESLAEQYNAEIVGYIEVTGDYQLRLKKEYTLEELKEIVNEIKSVDFVEDAECNYFSEVNINTAFVPNDPEWSNDWNDILPNGDNWGIEAVHAQHVWSFKERMTPINIGLIDWEFDTNHEDLDFAETFFNPQNITDSHGTHVAGTMAAGLDNGVGVAGVYPFGEGNSPDERHLYGVSYNGAVNGQGYSSSFFWKVALSELILRDVKIINVSMGYADVLKMFLAAKGYEEVQNSLNEQSRILGNFLERLIKKGYDFVIVSAAGNEGNAQFVQFRKTDTYPYGWMEVESGGETNDSLANWGSQLNAISNQDVLDRIIVVGAAQLSDIEDTGCLYEKCRFSSDGSRVDIMAPGYSIMSSVIGNRYEKTYIGDDGKEYIWAGTSMAAPHVSGIAASVWAYNPSLTGKRVKEIVVNPNNLLNDSNREVYGTRLRMASALYSIADASDELQNSNKNKTENGMIAANVHGEQNTFLTKIPYGISNAEVKVYDTKTNQLVDTQTTDKEGFFESIVPPGNYYLTITADGFEEAKLNNVEILKGQLHYDYILLHKAITDFSIRDGLILTIGEISVIEPETVPADASGYSLKWTSSDDSVLTVVPNGEVGIVTAKSKGTATITAELSSGGKTITRTTNLRVASKARDTVLVLDVSGSMYGEPLNEMKKSAIQFCNDLLKDEYNNRVGIVFYDDRITTIDLTSDLDMLIARIQAISDGGMTNMEAGLSAANQMLSNNGKSDAIKNVVVMADGLPNEGKTSGSGSMPSGSFSSYYTSVSYANAVIDTAKGMMNKYNLYSLGFFHGLYGEEKDFATALMKELTNQVDGYHQVDKAEDLQFAFGDISDEISIGSKIVINIACPVDVQVSYGGEMLSSSSSAYCDITSFGSLQLLGKNKDIKVVSLDSDKDYEVELTGTGVGKMDYSINYFDEKEQLSDYRTFESVPITMTTVISSNTNNSNDIELNIDEDGDGEIDTIWTALSKSAGGITFEKNLPEPEIEEDETADNSGLSTTTIILIAVGVIVLLGVVITVIAISKHSGSKEATEEKQVDDIPADGMVMCPRCGKVHHYTEVSDCSQHDGVKNLKYSEYQESGFVQVESGSMKGFNVPIKDKETLYLGKDPKHANIVFSSDYINVSRLHCSVTFDEKTGRYYVVDNSSNGTFFANKKRLVKGQRTAVDANSVLILANEECMIRLK